jgi:hypothetical protein
MVLHGTERYTKALTDFLVGEIVDIAEREDLFATW